MALNPELSNGQPVPMANEMFVLSRDGIHFSAKAGPRNKVDAYGTLYISTLRMVFVNDKAGSENAAFDIPLATLYKESFNQPIFGANNMTGLSPPLDLPEGADHWKWCISFRNGGVGTPSYAPRPAAEGGGNGERSAALRHSGACACDIRRSALVGGGLTTALCTPRPQVP